jgi:polar amino acid transport system substrate-binding protein
MIDATSCRYLDGGPRMSRWIGWRYIFAVPVLWIALIASTAGVHAAAPICEPAKLTQIYPGLAGKMLTVAMPADAKPVSYRDPADLDHLTGFAPDYARGVFGCLGTPYKIDVAPLSGALAAASSGRVDMVWSTIYYTPERGKVLDFVLYQKAASGGVVPHGNPLHINSLADLCGRSAVAQIGSLEQEKLEEANDTCVAEGKKSVEVVTTPDRASGLRLLENGRVDLYLGIGLKGAYPNEFDLPFIYTSDIRAGIGVTKGSTELERALAAALTALQAGGFERKLYSTYDIDPSLSFPPVIVAH